MSGGYNVTESHRGYVCPASTTSSSDSVSLCAVDASIGACYIQVAWVFRCAPPTEVSLRLALQGLLSPSRSMAPLSWRLRPGLDSSSHGSLDCSSGPGALWSVAHCPVALRVEDFEKGVAPSSDFWAAPQSAEYSEQVIPALVARYTQFSCGGVVLGVSFHHRVGDGHSFARFMREWQRVLCGRQNGSPTSPVSFSREVILRDVEAIDVSSLGPPDPPFFTSLTEGSCATSRTWTAQELTTLKGLASPAPGAPDQQWVSTRDALLAHIWKCLARAGGVGEPGDLVRASFTMDARARSTTNGMDSFMGNAAVVAHVDDEPTKERLLKEPLRDTALRIRRTVLSMQKPDRLKLSLSTMAHLASDHSRTVLGSYRVGLDITAMDWSSFDWPFLDNDPPTIFCVPLPPKPFPGHITVLPSTLKGGLMTLIATTSVQSSRLSLSLASP